MTTHGHVRDNSAWHRMGASLHTNLVETLRFMTMFRRTPVIHCVAVSRWHATAPLTCRACPAPARLARRLLGETQATMVSMAPMVETAARVAPFRCVHRPQRVSCAVSHPVSCSRQEAAKAGTASRAVMAQLGLQVHQVYPPAAATGLMLPTVKLSKLPTARTDRIWCAYCSLLHPEHWALFVPLHVAHCYDSLHNTTTLQ
jgi:hypothetical protein